jgi:hypothetical protein
MQRTDHHHHRDQDFKGTRHAGGYFFRQANGDFIFLQPRIDASGVDSGDQRGENPLTRQGSRVGATFMSQNTLKVHDLNEDAEFDENGAEAFDEKALVEEEPSDNDLAEEELLSQGATQRVLDATGSKSPLLPAKLPI